MYIQPDGREEGAQSELCNYVRAYVGTVMIKFSCVCEWRSQSIAYNTAPPLPPTYILIPSWGPVIVLCRYALLYVCGTLSSKVCVCACTRNETRRTVLNGDALHSPSNTLCIAHLHTFHTYALSLCMFAF